MDNLNAFLNPTKVENIKYVASYRFKVDKKPVEWEIRTVTAEEDEALRKRCKIQVPIQGKYGQYTSELDAEKYLGKMAALCTVYPNLFDAKLQDSYKTQGEDKLLKAMLLPGEYSRYVEKVQEINGFKPMDILIDEAKN